jgi:hypothetical protein
MSEREVELMFKVVRLRQALGYFLVDCRFDVSVGGNPDVVQAMLQRSRAVYEETAPKEPE